MTKSIGSVVVIASASVASIAGADNILVIEQGGHVSGDQAIQDLQNLGHSVSVVQSPQSLGTYQMFDQVWDMRYAANMTNQDAIDMGAYLQGGGSMLVLGEWSNFEGSRNISLRNWISQVGAGQIGNVVQGASTDLQAITAAGQVVNQPNNSITAIQYDFATTYTQANITQGFLVTSSANGDGGTIGWDFGDITGAPNARLLAVWDIEVWETGVNGIDWTENMATYLGRVPAPGSAAVLGLAGLIATGRRRKG
jgi:hypothetical protein